MGCDIHCFAERKDDAGKFIKVGDEFFDWRSYGLFGFLADVRNYSAIPPIAPPRGVPDDMSEGVATEFDGWGRDAHSASWLGLPELLSFDYDAACEDRRCTRLVGNVYDGGSTADPGEGQSMTFRAFLGEGYFEELEKLRAAGAERIVFWFDN